MNRGFEMKAKDYLKQIRKLDKLIENKLLEKEQWRAIATNATAQMNGERVQSSKNPGKMEDAIHRYLEIDSEINRYIDNLVDTKKEIINLIEKLSVAEYDLLHKVYVQYHTLDEVADLYDRSHSWATTVHGRALQHVQEILDERV